MGKQKQMKDRNFFELEKQIIELELEKTRLDRERGMIILNKSIFLYFTFIFVGIIGFMNHYLSSKMLDVMILTGLLALIIGSIPYVRGSQKEQETLTVILNDLLSRTGKKDKDFQKRLMNKKRGLFK